MAKRGPLSPPRVETVPCCCPRSFPGRPTPSPSAWAQPQSTFDPYAPKIPSLGGSNTSPPSRERLTGVGRQQRAGGLFAPRPGRGSQVRSELPRADARCLWELTCILWIPGSRPEVPQSYILHIWFQLGSGEGEPVSDPGWLFGRGYFLRPEGMCAKL